MLRSTMHAPVQALYATPAMRTLLRAEAAVLRSRLAARPGTHGLQLSMHAGAIVSPDPVAYWVRLHAAGGNWQCCLHARTDAPLPFANDSFAVVVLSQVHQHVPDCMFLIREAERVAAPDGLVMLTGVHPVSAWMPWLWWRMRGMHRSLHLHSPFLLGRDLAECRLDVEAMQRFGAAWPRDAGLPGEAAGGMFGGGFLVVARKRQHAVTPLHVLATPRRARVTGPLAPGAHRECA